MYSKKLGFWSVFALVTGSQIGTGILVLPASLAKFGIFGIYSWGVSIVGIIALAMVFANLCYYFPKTGGPHIYVQEIFGNRVAFFVGWTYWLVSWISSTAVIIEAISYLSPIIGVHDSLEQLAYEILLLVIITALNFRGAKAASSFEIVMVLLKILPLVIVPIGAFAYFNADNLVIDISVRNDSVSTNCANAVLLTVWGFVGLECATTVAGAIKNPSKTIPRALIFGTSAVAFLYFFNVLSIMGLINGTELMNMRSPYVDAVKNIIGGNWHLAISLGSSIVCVGTLNAWTLVSGQIAFGLGQSSLLPRIFTKQNKNGAPIFALCVSSVGTVILLAMTIDDNIVNQVTNVINFSATSFLFVYLICSLALIKFLLSRSQKLSYTKLSGSIIAAVFSLWVIYETPLDTLAIAATFTLSGIPVYWLWYRKRDKALD